ncbi:transcriptional regulator opi1, partial [Coemansia sp. RSA 2599]
VGSDVIESGVRKMYQPLAKRIDVAQLDSFACRQLDNLGYTSSAGNVGGGSSNLRKRTKDQADERGEAPTDNDSDSDSDNGKSRHSAGENQLAPLLPPRPQPQARTDPHSHPQQQQQQQGSAGARWRVVDLVASARERALAYREDSLRRLKYCLDWVVYATALVNQHIQELRRLLGVLQQAARTAFTDIPAAASLDLVRPTGGDDGHGGMMAQTIHEAAVRLSKARKEIVAAVRKAVGVVSHYAGSVLPGEARRQVRALVLGLPRRLGAADPSMMAGAGSASGRSASSAGSPSVASSCNSPFASPRQGPQRLPSDMSAANIEATTRRTLTFASESFVMLDALRNVFSNLYANAERWIGVPADLQQQAHRDQHPNHHHQNQNQEHQHQHQHQNQHQHQHHQQDPPLVHGHQRHQHDDDNRYQHQHRQEHRLPLAAAAAAAVASGGVSEEPAPRTGEGRVSGQDNMASAGSSSGVDDPLMRYRDSRQTQASAGMSLPSIVRRPPRRLPLNMTPMAGAPGAAEDPGMADPSSMIEIGEQMRLMDMTRAANKHGRQQSLSSSSSMSVMDVDGRTVSSYRHSRQHSAASSYLDAANSAGAAAHYSSSARHSAYASPRYGPLGSHHVSEEEHQVAHKRNRTREPTPTRI